MLKIAGNEYDSSDILDEYPPNSIERKTIDILSESEEIYEYSSVEQLRFELNLRASIVKASKELYRSGMAFRVFRKSTCNEKFWNRTQEGGFLLKDGVKPSDAIKDIFINGSMYGTECATAIVIVYYKAVLNIYPSELFDQTFPNIHLMNWHYVNRNLRVFSYRDQADYLPGDCMYFKNPDVDPLTPHWQGENAIDLGNGLYYGHGIGIKTGEQIIQVLNRFRREDATETAYLMNSATRPLFNHLAKIYYNFTPDTSVSNYYMAVGC